MGIEVSRSWKQKQNNIVRFWSLHLSEPYPREFRTSREKLLQLNYSIIYSNMQEFTLPMDAIAPCSRNSEIITIGRYKIEMKKQEEDLSFSFLSKYSILF